VLHNTRPGAQRQPDSKNHRKLDTL
jgi:hypothetical protein